MAIMRVFLFLNGMMAVFDDNGHQMPDHQGYIHKRLSAVLSECSSTTTFNCQAYGYISKGDVERNFSDYVANSRRRERQHKAMRKQYREKSTNTTT